MSPEKQRIALPELMAMGDEQLNRLAAQGIGLPVQNCPYYGFNGLEDNWCLGIATDSYIQIPKYTGSRDLAFSLRKDFTDAQFKDWSFNLMTIIQLDLKDEPAIGYKSKFDRAYDDCSARYWTIAAVMVLQSAPQHPERMEER